MVNLTLTMAWWHDPVVVFSLLNAQQENKLQEAMNHINFFQQIFV